ncbi:hypothetical protein V7S43_004453 [Phytophthora oleae]|uniref:Protein kinase domain-containing protein n=1 Tax=Phytophthora oleae TaxID=2107226 RepID=A0ABD3FTT9_9STRA
MASSTCTSRLWQWFERLWLRLSVPGYADPIGDVEVNPYESFSVEELFLHAAQHGYEDIIREVFISSNLIADINCTNENGWTALLYAASNNHTSIVEFLIDHGAFLGARNYQDLEALHLAAAQGFLDTVKVLVEAGADIGSVGMSDMTPLHCAIKHGRFSVVQFLIEWLLSKNEQELVHELLEVHVYAGEWTALNVAADEGTLDIVVFLTEHDAVLNTKNEHGFSPLHSAVAKSHGDVVKHLLSIGADVDTRTTIGGTPLGTAAKHGLTEMAALLLDAGADIHTVNHNGCTPLLTAATDGHEEVVKLLLNRGANLEDRTNEGWTSLIIAAEKGYSTLIKSLVSRGASIDSKTHDGATALSVATQQGHMETCRILIDLLGLRGELVLNAPDIHGRTVLHYAVLTGKMELMELLVRYGATVNTADYQDATPMNLAILECNVNIIQYLTAHGAAPFNDSNEIWTLTALEELYIRSFECDEPRTSDPKWFIDPATIQHERSFQTYENNFTKASVCSWLGAPVIVLENLAMRVPEVIYNLSPKAMELGIKIRASFAKEVARWLPLNHPHVLKLYGACHRLQQLLVMERVSGETMREYLQRHPEKTWKILYEAALAVQYLHERGIFHGYIRGDNILVTDCGSAKLGGFGFYSLNFGKEQESTAWEPVDRLEGGVCTPENDVYSLGMCVIEAVTGEPPYGEQEDVRFLISNGLFPERSPKFSDRAWLLVTRMSTFSKRQRLSIDDVVRELKDFAADEARSLSPELQQPVSHALVEEQLALAVSLVYTQNQLEPERQAVDRLNQLWLAVAEVPERLRSFCTTVTELVNHLKRYTTNTTAVSRRFSERRQAGAMFSLHNDIDRLVHQFGLDSTIVEVHEWRKNWYNARAARMKRFEATLTDEELEKLENSSDYVEVLTCLYFELTRHRLSYTPIQPRIFHSACQRIKRLPDVKVEDWFLPPYEVDFNHDDLDAFSRGGYGSVHHGTWMNSPVVVKKVLAPDADAFEREVGIWFQLFHPYVVQLFGACHLDGQQYFVCEDAVNGQLDRYLRRRDVNRNRVVWQRLYETVVALQFLHGKGVLHRDLKCNNILIGIDGRVKLADFGLSSVISDGDTRASGAVRWQAPEIIRGEAASCASDVYGLAMCVLEAVTGEYPWGDDVGDYSVRYSLLEGKGVARPAGFTDEGWELVQRMTSFKPTERLALEKVVEEMRGFAEIEAEMPDMPDPEDVLPVVAATTDQSESTVGCTSALSTASSAYASCVDSTSADHFARSY